MPHLPLHSSSESRHIAASPLRRLWDSLPTNEFLDLSALKSFGLNSPTILFKFESSLAAVDLKLTRLAPLPFGEVFAISCADLTIAYQISMPSCHYISIGANFAAFAKKRVTTPEINRYLVDKQIAIIGNVDSLVVVSNRIYWTAEDDSNRS